MSTWAVTCLAMAPLAWLLAAFVARRGDVAAPWPTLRASLAAATLGPLLVIVAAGGLIAGNAAPGLLALGEFVGPLVRLDALSLSMAGLVNFIGVVVLRYSHAYLAGDPRQFKFLGDICITVGAVTVLAVSGSAFVLFIGWMAMSLALHRLLVFRGERRGARLAARKKFFLARLSDASLGLALLSLMASAGSADLAVINAAAAAAPAGTFVGPALLLALAAILKSAQFPVHGWLTEVMEAPTPVSALLHAGVVNAGGFLLVRFGDVIVASPAALYVLMVVGGFTALFGSLVMLTQRSVKTALAYSTVAQMGFMLLQCGLGAFAPAMLHIVAHSVYKAHAFLSSSSIVDLARGSGAQGSAARISPVLLPLSLVLAGGVFYAWAEFFQFTLVSKPAIVGLGAIVLMGMVHLVVQSTRGAPTPLILLRVTGTAAVVAGLYFTLQALAAVTYEAVLPANAHLDAVQWVLMVVVLLSFAGATVLQWTLPALQRSAWGRALWVHLSNGLYINQLSDQVLRAYRVDSQSPS